MMSIVFNLRSSKEAAANWLIDHADFESDNVRMSAPKGWRAKGLEIQRLQPGWTGASPEKGALRFVSEVVYSYIPRDPRGLIRVVEISDAVELLLIEAESGKTKTAVSIHVPESRFVWPLVRKKLSAMTVNWPGLSEQLETYSPKPEKEAEE